MKDGMALNHPCVGDKNGGTCWQVTIIYTSFPFSQCCALVFTIHVLQISPYISFQLQYAVNVAILFVDLHARGNWPCF